MSAAKKQHANMIGIHHKSVAAIRNAPRKTPPSHTAPGSADVEADYTKVVELDAQHLVFRVTIVAN